MGNSKSKTSKNEKLQSNQMLPSQPKKVANSRITATDRAILELKKQRDQLKRRLKQIETQEEKLKTMAKNIMTNNPNAQSKQKALLLLKKSKIQAASSEKISTMLDNVQTMTNEIESAEMNIKITNALKDGSSALKELQKLCSLEDVEKIMDDVQEGIDYQREIDQAIAGTADNLQIELDEDELWNAFVEEEEVDINKQLEQTPEVANNQLPEIPLVEVDQEVIANEIENENVRALEEPILN